jgi:Immunity protein 44
MQRPPSSSVTSDPDLNRSTRDDSECYGDFSTVVLPPITIPAQDRKRSMNQNAGRSKMSKFWWSGEVQADVADTYTEAMKAVDAELNRLLDGVLFGGKVDEWAFIAIIREGNSPDYREIARKSSRGKSLEFRLKMSHADFLAAHARQRISLIFKALSRSVLMMENLEVSTDTRRTLQAVLFQAENALVSGLVYLSKPGA